MKRAQRARRKSMEINWLMRAFAGGRHAVKLLFRVASSGVEDGQAETI